MTLAGSNFAARREARLFTCVSLACQKREKNDRSLKLQRANGKEREASEKNDLDSSKIKDQKETIARLCKTFVRSLALIILFRKQAPLSVSIQSLLCNPILANLLPPLPSEAPVEVISAPQVSTLDQKLSIGSRRSSGSSKGFCGVCCELAPRRVSLPLAAHLSAHNRKVAAKVVTMFFAMIKIINHHLSVCLFLYLALFFRR